MFSSLVVYGQQCTVWHFLPLNTQHVFHSGASWTELVFHVWFSAVVRILAYYMYSLSHLWKRQPYPQSKYEGQTLEVCLTTIDKMQFFLVCLQLPEPAECELDMGESTNYFLLSYWKWQLRDSIIFPCANKWISIYIPLYGSNISSCCSTVGPVWVTLGSSLTSAMDQVFLVITSDYSYRRNNWGIFSEIIT